MFVPERNEKVPHAKLVNPSCIHVMFKSQNETTNQEAYIALEKIIIFNSI